MRPLKRLHFHRVVLQAPELARRRDRLLREAALDRLIRLRVHLRGLRGVDPKCIELVWRRAAADPELKSTAAQVIENANLFVETRGMIDRQQIDQRAQTQSPGPLGQSR